MDFRPLTSHEREVIERLLEPRFPGRDELRAQLAVATARPKDDHGCIELRVESAPRAPVKHPIPAEGECTDNDGLTIQVHLQVVDGYLAGLVVFKLGGDDPLGLPPARDLKLFAAYSDEAGVWNRSPKFP